MEIIHRVAFDITEENQKILSDLGLHSKEFDIKAFYISENNKQWPKLEKVIEKWGVTHSIGTKFSKSELDSAEYLAIGTQSRWGYPQPEDTFGYSDINFNLSNYSEDSGIGAIQTGPIRIKKEPKWGKKYILQLNWMPDIFFVRADIWEDVFKPFGIKKRSVIIDKKNVEAKNIFQIIPQGEVDLELDKNLPSEFCEKNKIKKFKPISRGFFPPIKKGEKKLDFFQTKNYFGHGRIAFKETLVSQKLYKEIQKRGIKNLSFMPLSQGN